MKLSKQNRRTIPLKLHGNLNQEKSWAIIVSSTREVLEEFRSYGYAFNRLSHWENITKMKCEIVRQWKEQ